MKKSILTVAIVAIISSAIGFCAAAASAKIPSTEATATTEIHHCTHIHTAAKASTAQARSAVTAQASLPSPMAKNGRSHTVRSVDIPNLVINKYGYKNAKDSSLFSVSWS